MVIRFQFALLTKRNGEGNEVSRLAVCVWREKGGREGCTVYTFQWPSLPLSRSSSHTLIHCVMLFIAGIVVLLLH